MPLSCSLSQSAAPIAARSGQPGLEPGKRPVRLPLCGTLTPANHARFALPSRFRPAHPRQVNWSGGNHRGVVGLRSPTVLTTRALYLKGLALLRFGVPTPLRDNPVIRAANPRVPLGASTTYFHSTESDNDHVAPAPVLCQVACFRRSGVRCQAKPLVNAPRRRPKKISR